MSLLIMCLSGFILLLFAYSAFYPFLVDFKHQKIKIDPACCWLVKPFAHSLNVLCNVKGIHPVLFLSSPCWTLILPIFDISR